MKRELKITIKNDYNHYALIEQVNNRGNEINRGIFLDKDQYEQLRQHFVSGSLPSKDEAVNVGFRKATVEGYNYRRVCREPDHDIYYSGWMDCYDWLSGNDR